MEEGGRQGKLEYFFFFLLRHKTNNKFNYHLDLAKLSLFKRFFSYGFMILKIVGVFFHLAGFL